MCCLLHVLHPYTEYHFVGDWHLTYGGAASTWHPCLCLADKLSRSSLSQAATSNEGGVAAGFAVLDSPCLVE